MAAAWRESAEPSGSPGREDSDPLPGGRVLPGDVNQSAVLEIGDAIRLLRHLFLGDATPLPCEGQTISDGGNLLLADFNGNGGVEAADAIQLLGYLFQLGPAHAHGTGCVRIEGCTTACRG